MSKLINPPKFDWSIFSTGSDISRIATEIEQKLKLLKNDAVLFGLIDFFLISNKLGLDEEIGHLRDNKNKYDELHSALDEEKDAAKKEELIKELDKIAAEQNEKVEKHRFNTASQYGSVRKYQRYRKEILELVRETLNGLFIKAQSVNIGKILLIELLYMINVQIENPVLDKVFSIYQERLLTLTPDFLKFNQVDRATKKIRTSIL